MQLLGLGPQKQPCGSQRSIPQQTPLMNINIFLYSFFFAHWNITKNGLSWGFFALQFSSESLWIPPSFQPFLVKTCLWSVSIPQLNVLVFFSPLKAKNVWRSATCTLVKHNPPPSDLPINCSWYSAELSIPESTSVFNCRQRPHISVAQRTHTHARTHTHTHRRWVGERWENQVPNNASWPNASHLCFLSPWLLSQEIAVRSIRKHFVHTVFFFFTPTHTTHCRRWAVRVAEVACVLKVTSGRKGAGGWLFQHFNSMLWICSLGINNDGHWWGWLIMKSDFSFFSYLFYSWSAYSNAIYISVLKSSHYSNSSHSLGVSCLNSLAETND